MAPLRRRLTALRLPPAPSELGRPGLPARIVRPGHDPWNDPAALTEGEFRFLGRPLQVGWPPHWQAGERAGLPLLWRFNLHYHEFLPLLEPAERVAVCRDWTERNPPGAGVPWHPYVLSRRITSWCRFLPPEAGPELAESLWRQTAYLARNVERHVLGNHLLDNARALVLAAAWMGDRSEVAPWRALGLEILREQVTEQVLSDGIHFERSPMYQALVLEMLLDVLNVLPEGHSGRPVLEPAARAMGDGLWSLVHPDGGIALLNDAALEVAPPASSLLSSLRALTGHEPRRRSAFPEAGYYVWDAEPAWLVMDGGPIGPDYLPAHGHADAFTYELSLGGERFVVDTGVSGYAAGPERDRERGTRAHNTVCVDGVDQAEVWGSFRVGRRWAPERVSFVLEDAGSGAAGGRGFRFEGEFGGYARLIGDGIRHRRVITGRRDGPAPAAGGEIRVEDQVTGRGEHRVESLIHLHPDVRMEREPGQDRALRLTRDGVEARLVVEAGRLVVEDSSYSPRFGESLPSKAVVVREERLPARLCYRIKY